MKFTKIRLVGLHTIDLPLVGALPSDPYILKASDGLGPPEIDVMLAETRNEESVYQGSRTHGREPVIRIGLNPDHGVGQTASDLRSSMYGLLTPGPSGDIRLEVVDGETVVAQTHGHAKRLETVPFSETPEVQLTMACLESYLQDPNVLYLDPGGSQSAPEILNTGTAPTGFHMEVIFTANLSSWSLIDVNGQKMEFDYDFLSGDKLAIDTRGGHRGIWLTRDDVTTSILYSLAPGSVWHRLHGGNNVFATSSSSFTWADVFFRPQYWGI